MSPEKPTAGQNLPQRSLRDRRHTHCPPRGDFRCPRGDFLCAPPQPYNVLRKLACLGVRKRVHPLTDDEYFVFHRDAAGNCGPEHPLGCVSSEEAHEWYRRIVEAEPRMLAPAADATTMVPAADTTTVAATTTTTTGDVASAYDKLRHLPPLLGGTAAPTR
jgi:hypothetical protein